MSWNEASYQRVKVWNALASLRLLQQTNRGWREMLGSMTKLELPAAYRDGSTVIIGFDSEYVQPPAQEAKRKDKKGARGARAQDAKANVDEAKNDVVSYQAYLLSSVGEHHWIRLMKKGERMTIRQIIGSILCEGMKAGKLGCWPENIHLAIHWSLADLTTLQDFQYLKHRFDGLRKTYVSINGSYPLKFWDYNRNEHELTIRLFDTLLLAPDGARKLEDLGKLLGSEKIVLPPGAIEDMRTFCEADPELFCRYGLQDAVIAAHWLVFSNHLARELFGSDSTPLTLGSMAVKLVQKVWSDQRVDRHEVLGTELVKIDDKWEEVYRKEREAYARFARDAFHGGRNETYFFGATPERAWTDWDLSGAYVTGLCSLGTPVWKEIRRPRSVEEFRNFRVYGAALVEFSFSEGTPFPCLPVRSESSLLFPLQGKSMATAPEIYLALQLGARMRIVNDIGYIMPMRNDQPFGMVAKLVTDRREELKAAGMKDSAEELGIKTIGNSVYGKLSQGMRRKRVFQTRTGGMDEIPPSPLTNEFLAGYTTGFVRAVLSEIIAAIPPEYIVVSATTDGFITNAPDEVVRKATAGPLCRLYLQLRQALDPKCDCALEVKHHVKQAMAWRTRGQATLIEGDDPEPKKNVILAKAGISVPLDQRGDPNGYIVRKFIERGLVPEKERVERFHGLREIYEADGRIDLVRKIMWIATSMDFDWKRLPHDIGTRPIRGFEHLWFTTKPLPSVAAYEHLRADWKSFSKKGTSQLKRYLKTEHDLGDFFDRMSVVKQMGLTVPRNGGAGEKLLLRMFLRAFSRKLLGLDEKLLAPELVEKLASVGITEKITNIENANRSTNTVIYGCLHRTPVVVATVGKLKQLFPGFNPEPLFANDACPLSYDFELHPKLGGEDPLQLQFNLVRSHWA